MSTYKSFKEKDRLFSQPLDQVQEFSFDPKVASAFDDMILRSVPLYQDVQALTLNLCLSLAQDQSSIYDIGCASGTSLALLKTALGDRPLRIVGIDNSAAMLAICRDKMASIGQGLAVELVEADLRFLLPVNASIIILNYTLQFIEVRERLSILKNLYRGLLPGGALLLSEKVLHKSPGLQDLLYEMHHEFKRSNGYSDLEISQKRDALENVLVPLSTEDNIALLKQAGFEEVEIYAKWYNFASLIALKR